MRKVGVKGGGGLAGGGGGGSGSAHLEVLEYLAVVDVPNGLVVPDLRGEQNRAEHYAAPRVRRHLHLRVRHQALQVHLRAEERRVISSPVCPFMTCPFLYVLSIAAARRVELMSSSLHLPMSRLGRLYPRANQTHSRTRLTRRR